jgi:hypothetical protein
VPKPLHDWVPIEIEGAEDPWEGIGPTSEVSLPVELSNNAQPNSPVGVLLSLDGQARSLQGRLRTTTPSEHHQLRAGTMFEACLSEALRKIAAS